MKVSDYINDSKKRLWTRRVLSSMAQAPNQKGSNKRRRVAPPAGSYIYLRQEDFLNELTPGAHDINSKYMSKRPIYKDSGEKNAKGQTKWVLVGYDDVETVALGIQECIIGKKISHFAGDGFWISNETEDKARFDKLISWMDMAGISHAAWLQLVRSVFRTGDGAIYLYRTEEGIEYKVFGYEEGSVLYPKTDINGKTTVARKYTFDGHATVDIFTGDGSETWMMIDENDDDFHDYVKEDTTKSEDGWYLVKKSEPQAGKGRCQCIYFRIDDIPTGPAQLSIEALEDACSYMSEEMKNTAFPILFLKSEKLVSLPPSEMNGKTIGVKGSSDALAHSDAKFLAPPDASNTATIHLKNLWDNIVRTCMSVFVEPDVLKQGADSSTTIKIMFAPEIQWCQNIWPQFFKGVRDIMTIMKALVGAMENDIKGYEKLRTSVGPNVWMPQNIAEQVKNECDQVYARIKSREAAMEDLGSQHVGDYGKIKEEWEYEIRIKSEIPAEVKAKYGVSGDGSGDSGSGSGRGSGSGSGKTGVTKQAAGKSIQGA